MYPTAAPLPCIASGPPSAPTYSWNTCLRTQISPISISFRCTDTGPVTVASPPKPLFSSRTWLQHRGELSHITTFWRDANTPAILLGHTHIPRQVSQSHATALTLPIPPYLERESHPPFPRRGGRGSIRPFMPDRPMNRRPYPDCLVLLSDLL